MLLGFAIISFVLKGIEKRKKTHRSVLWCEIFVFGHWLVTRPVLTTVPCGFLTSKTVIRLSELVPLRKVRSGPGPREIPGDGRYVGIWYVLTTMTSKEKTSRAQNRSSNTREQEQHHSSLF